MKKIFLILVSLILFTSCAVNPPAQGLKYKFGNDCLPQAAVMCESLREKGIDANVLLISTSTWRHSVATYMYPIGQNKLWAWDTTWKSLRLRAWKDNPESIAKEWLNKTNHREILVEASFL